MTDDDWNNGFARCLGLRSPATPSKKSTRGNRILDDTLLILLNAHHEPVSFVLPAHRRKVRWQVVFDTKEEKIKRRQRLIRGGTEYPLEARSVALLRLPHHETGESTDLDMSSV